MKVQNDTEAVNRSKVMTLIEVADNLRVHPSTIYRLVKRNKLPAFRVGGDWRFNSESIDRWLVDQERDSGTRSNGQ